MIDYLTVLVATGVAYIFFLTFVHLGFSIPNENKMKKISFFISSFVAIGMSSLLLSFLCISMEVVSFVDGLLIASICYLGFILPLSWVVSFFIKFSRRDFWMGLILILGIFLLIGGILPG